MVIKACCTVGGVFVPVGTYHTQVKNHRVSYHVSTTGILIGKVLFNSERRECGGKVEAKKSTSDVIRAFKSKPREIPIGTVFWPGWWLF